MKTLKPLPIVILGLLAALAGCQKEPAGPEEISYTVVITGLPQVELSAPEGFHRAVPFGVMVHGNTGLPFAHGLVTFSVAEGVGYIDPPSVDTDIDGEATATLHLRIPSGHALTVVKATVASSFTGTDTLRYYGAPRPMSLNLTCVEPEVVVGSDDVASIELVARLLNGAGNPVYGVLPEFSVSRSQGGEPFGSLSRALPTDSSGVTRVTFTSRGEFGTERVNCTLADSTGAAPYLNDYQEIAVRSRASTIETLTLNVEPDELFVRQGDIGEAVVTAEVRDESNFAVQGVEINFRTSIGSLTRSNLTDASGIAWCYFHNNGEYGEAAISATVDETGLQQIVHLKVDSIPSLTYTLTLSTDREFIYADNGVTQAQLTAVLKDDRFRAVQGVPVVFTSDYGSATSPVTTDAAGHAVSMFRDLGAPSFDADGNLVPATIVAEYRAGNARATEQVIIREWNQVGEIQLAADEDTSVVGGDSLTVTADLTLVSGRKALDGTRVTFGANLGAFWPPTVSTQNSVSQTQYSVGTVSGRARLTAFVVNPGGDTLRSTGYNIVVLPGEADHILVEVSGGPINLNNPDSYIDLSFKAVDEYGNETDADWDNLQVTTTMGELELLSQAVWRLRAGEDAAPGVAQVEAAMPSPGGIISGTANVPFNALPVELVRLNATPSSIPVSPNGSSEITATLIDAEGFSVKPPLLVLFELLGAPAPPLGGDLDRQGLAASKMTEDGIASVTFYSGQLAIPGTVRATAPSGDGSVRETIQVQVVPGAPAEMELTIGDDVRDVGGGSWGVEVACRVTDTYGNDQPENLPVVFSVEPDIASISPGHIGNLNREGQAVPGTAFSELVFNSNNTGDTLTITAVVQTEAGEVSEDFRYILPLVEGEILLTASPSAFTFDVDEPDVACDIRIWGTVTDGHNIRVNSVPIRFTAERGLLYWQDENEQWHNSGEELAILPSGVATVYLRDTQDVFFAGVDENEVQYRVEAVVEGYPDVEAEPVVITFTRR